MIKYLFKVIQWTGQTIKEIEIIEIQADDIVEAWDEAIRLAEESYGKEASVVRIFESNFSYADYVKHAPPLVVSSKL